MTDPTWGVSAGRAPRSISVTPPCPHVLGLVGRATSLDVGSQAVGGPMGAAAIRDAAVRALFGVALDLERLRPVTDGAGRAEIDRLLGDLDACIRGIRDSALAASPAP